LGRADGARDNFLEDNMLASVDDLFLDFLKDIYFAEKKILKSIPKLVKGAQNAELKAALTEHRAETEGQIERLQQVFEILGKPARAKTCEAINGLFEEADELFEDTEAGAVRDAGIVACAQAVEHYEMARYGALIAWAKLAGKGELVTLLQETLEQEKKADELLNKLGTAKVNPEALKQAA
jgi:ferritin-like metal-binding protein YciE